MPNHIHMIIAIDYSGRPRASAPTVGTIVSSIKSYITKWTEFDVWQKGFYDRVIRNQQEYIRISDYIDNNPLQWLLDKYYID